MRKKKITLLSAGVLLLLAGFLLAPPAGAEMLKEVAIGVFDNAPSQAETDWFYLRYHGPEVTRLSGPWMSRYQLWLPYDPPEEAVRLFGAVRGRYAELWYRAEDYLDRPAMRGITRPPFNEMEGAKQSGQTNVMVPANPTDEFLDLDPHPEETPILRWVTFICYPEGVSVEEGEKWFKEVYAKEAVKQPGLLKFVSHKVWKNENAAATEGGMPPGVEMPAGEVPKMKQWVRMCEYWYTGFDAWRKAVLESPPEYTAPAWGGAFPFVDMASTFIPYSPDVDFLKGTYTLDYEYPNVTYGTSP
jgi:hypothetical protein